MTRAELLRCAAIASSIAWTGCRTPSHDACGRDAGPSADVSAWDAPGSEETDAGVARRVFADRASVAFGPQCLGRDSAPLDVIVANGGTDPLALAASVTGRDASAFAVTASCAATLSARSFCRVTVTMHADVPGSREASLVLQVGEDVLELPVRGEVAFCDGPVARPATVDFGEVRVGERSAPRTLVVQNLGATSEPYDAVMLGGPDADQMEITWDSCAGNGLASSAVCEVDVVFAPTRAGAAGALVELRAFFGTSASLTGIGVAP